MTADSPDENGGRGHLEALIHGIFAITMTLLILDLRLDGGRDRGQLWPALQDLAPQAAAYVFGFVYLASNWLALTDMFRALVRIDKVVSWLLLWFVALLSLTPFLVSTIAASVHNEHDLGVATRLMAVVVGLSFIPPVLLNRYGFRRDLFRDVGLAVYGASLPVLLAIACGPSVLAFALSYAWPPLGLIVLTVDLLVGTIANSRTRSEQSARSQ